MSFADIRRNAWSCDSRVLVVFYGLFGCLAALGNKDFADNCRGISVPSGDGATLLLRRTLRG